MLANTISEIGDISVFETADQFISWTGLAPSSHSSGGKVKNGRIGRTGNRYLKRILFRWRDIAARTMESVLGRFCRHVKMHRGAPIAIVTLARKILAIIHHPLTNMEPYEDPGVNKRVGHRKFVNVTSFQFRERLRLLVRLKMRLEICLA